MAGLCCTAAIFRTRSVRGRQSILRRGGQTANLGEPKVMHLTSACGYVMEAQVAAATGGMVAISIA